MPQLITALVLCLGAGTRIRAGSRMWPLSLAQPKALLPFCGRPLLEYTLEQFRRYQIRRVVIIAGICDSGFDEFESWGRADGMDVHVMRREVGLGSAGVVKQVVEDIECLDERLLVVYGDSLFQIDLQSLLDLHEHKQPAGCMTTIAYNFPDDVVIPGTTHTKYGIVWLAHDERITRFVEKPATADLSSRSANSAVFVLNREVLGRFPSRLPLDFSTEIFTEMATGPDSSVFGFQIKDGYRYDVGTIKSYIALQFAALDGLIPVDGMPSSTHGEPIPSQVALYGRANVGVHCRFGDGVALREHNVIGNAVSIGDKAVLTNCVILEGTMIGMAAKISGAVIGRHCQVAANTVVRDGTIIGDFSIIT